MMPKYDTFENQIHTVRADFIARGLTVNRQEWQALRDNRPQMTVFECYNVIIQTEVPTSVAFWQEQVKPNLPWAEDHFQERVSGEPLNPGQEYANWPWYEQGVEEHKEGGQFSHTYMERMWTESNDYGTIEDLVHLLIDRPYTRQAYHTIWWPNDTMMAKRGERVPCTLGYHFQARPYGGPEKDDLDMFYPMRSCDYFRYLRDDAYMAGRLLQWVAEKVGMYPGKLTMHIANLHIFNDEHQRLRDEHKAELDRRLSGAF